MKDIKVSIITPSYNQEEFIERTILSVLNQTYKNIEYIVVDGKSTDKSLDIIKKYADKIDIIIHEKDTGQSNAINKGFKLATGDLVGWINSDDVLYPTCIEKIVELYKTNPDGGVYYSNKIDSIDINDNKIGECSTFINQFTDLLKLNYDVCQQASFYPKSLLEEIKYINEDLNFCMDLDLWLRLLKNKKAYSYTAGSLAAIRIGDHTKTSNFRRPFIREIRNTLFKYGASTKDKTIVKTYKEEFKFLLLDLLKK